MIINSITSVFSLADDKTVVLADNNAKKPRVVVSMGDSYSSGEGVEPFYGIDNPDSNNFYEWLAHRSTKSWAGELKLPKLGKLKDHKVNDDSNYKSTDKLLWYFVASSGAEIKDICGYKKKFDGGKRLVGQMKKYSTYKDRMKKIGKINTTYLNPQIEVLDHLKEQDIVPDYITITIGGNDVGFADIISEAAVKSNYLNPNSLINKLTEARKNLNENSVFRKKLNKVYHDINNAASIGNRKPRILVGGYPGLLDISGRGIPFNMIEAEMINTSVEAFNKVINEEVIKCQKDMNIEFVDVLPHFYTHEAYSNNGAWINKVVLFPRNQDINKGIVVFNKNGKIEPNLASARSMHPNKKGVKEYAKCFQTIIDEIEGTVKDTAKETVITEKTQKIKADDAFLEYLKKQYNKADEYKNGLPVFHEIKHIWKDFIVSDFDGDGKKEMIIHLSYYSTDVSNETGDMFYYFEYENGKVKRKDYFYVPLVFEYDYDFGHTLFYQNQILFIEGDGDWTVCMFSDRIRKKYGLNEDQYLRYEYISGEDEAATYNRMKCTPFVTEDTKILSYDEFRKEIDDLTSSKYLDEVVVYPTTKKGIKMQNGTKLP